MKTFNESVRAKNTFDLLESCFRLMVENNINPMNFVNALENNMPFTEHQMGDISLGYSNPVSPQQPAQQPLPQVTKAPDGPVQDALHAVRELSRRSAIIANKINDPSFAQEVIELIGMLNNKRMLQPDALPVNPMQPTVNGPQVTVNQPQSAGTVSVPSYGGMTISQPQNAWHVPSGFSTFMEDKVFDAKVTQLEQLFVSCGVKPESFIEWYEDRGQFLSGRLFEEDFQDFLGNVGAGVSGAANNFANNFGPGMRQVGDTFKNWWGSLRNTLSAGWKSGQERRQTQMATNAAQTTINRLENLKAQKIGMPELTRQMDSVIASLRKFLGGQPTT